MKYLFFDIECSNNFNGRPKMCEFGYVLTDDQFKVLRKDDIPMSPGHYCHDNKFDMSIHKRDPEFEWAYDPDYYFSCPEFPFFYETIKNLLKMEDAILFGFAVSNDIWFIDCAIKRYKLKPFDYVVYDIQNMAQFFAQRKKALNLEATFKEFCPIEEFIRLQPHLSRDDAYMSMRILEELTKKNHLTPSEIIGLSKDFRFSSEEYLSKCYQEAKEKQERAFRHAECKRLSDEFYRECSLSPSNSNSPRKVVRISGAIKTNLELLKETIEAIKEKGFLYLNRVNEYDYFVVADEEDLEGVNSSIKSSSLNKTITLSDFKKLK